MKLNKIRTAAVVAAMAVATTVGAFAQKPEGKGCPRPDFRPGHHVPFNFGEKQIMGTISSVNADAQIITITDADGKSRKIHINPLTNIGTLNPPKNLPPKDKMPEKKADKKDKMRQLPPPFFFERLEIENLKAGQWVTVQKFNTDTETAEAMNITVHNGRSKIQPTIDYDAK